jgi:hypothetical protein
MDDAGRRGPLIFASHADALKIAADTDYECLEPTSVTPAEIEAVCANHGYALVGLAGGDISVSD